MDIIDELNEERPTVKKVQIGEIKLDVVKNQIIGTVNKTRLYLLPCLREYGEPFVELLRQTYKVAVGVGDFIAEKAGRIYEQHIFILCDTQAAPLHFNRFLDYIKEQPYYEDSYVYDNIQKTRFHMVVIKLPEQYLGSFQRFKKGEYSKMFSKENIDKFFQKHPKATAVFIKDHNYRVVFTDKVNQFMGNKGIDKLLPEEWEGELDFPPEDNKEVFNNYLK